MFNALMLVTREEEKERDRTQRRNRRKEITLAPLNTHTHTHIHTQGLEKGREIISVPKEFLGEFSPEVIFSRNIRFSQAGTHAHTHRDQAAWCSLGWL